MEAIVCRGERLGFESCLRERTDKTASRALKKRGREREQPRSFKRLQRVKVLKAKHIPYVSNNQGTYLFELPVSEHASLITLLHF